MTNLAKWGLTNLVDFPTLKSPESFEAAYASLEEISLGKDTTTGHWEIAGTIIKKEFPTYPKGFPVELLDKWVKENNLEGF